MKFLGRLHPLLAEAKGVAATDPRSRGSFGREPERSASERDLYQCRNNEVPRRSEARENQPSLGPGATTGVAATYHVRIVRRSRQRS